MDARVGLRRVAGDVLRSTTQANGRLEWGTRGIDPTLRKEREGWGTPHCWIERVAAASAFPLKPTARLNGPPAHLGYLGVGLSHPSLLD